MRSDCAFGKMENPNVTYMELRSIKQRDTAVSLFSQICSASSVFTPVKGGELERLCLFSCSFRYTGHDLIHPSSFDLKTVTAAIFLAHTCGGPAANGISDI